MSYDDAQVRPLERHEAGKAGALLARSHHQDPAFARIYPDVNERVRALSRVFDQWCRDALPFGAVDALSLNGRIAGVAAWMPPGSFPPTIGRQLRYLPDYLPVLAIAPRSFVPLVRFMGRASTHHPEQPNFYLEIVGLDDGYRGRGLGNRLLEHGLARADARDLPCYLETAKESNVSWYRRFGFTIAERAVKLAPRGPTHCTMWRPSRGETS